jgi:hypothetical protein
LLKPPFAQLGMLTRLARDLPGFLRTPMTLEQAEAIVKRRLETRPERFLALAQQAIYRQARSPYLRLLRSVGCEFDDLRTLVAREGLEGALGRLADLGVYVSFDEYKGRREIVRGSERFAPAEEDFNNRLVAPHFERRSSGSRSRGTSVNTSLEFVAELAVDHAVALHAHRIAEADHAIWLTAPLQQLLRHAKVGPPMVAWFYPLKPLPWKIRAAGRCLQIFGRLVSCPLPGPAWNDLQEPGRMAAWLGDRLADGRRVCLTAFASAAVRVAVAAREQGILLDGVSFIACGEPFTDGKRRAFEAVGARALVRYSCTEAGTVGYSCVEGGQSDDLHFFSDCLALIQRPARVGESGLTVQALQFSTLLPSTPKILLNVETGDHGTLEQRDCGCLMGALGLREHISDIRSHEKLTSEGMTFVKVRLLRVLEDVLPEKFGGSTGDYQVLEEADGNGILRLGLLVSPRVGALDEAGLKRTFLAELGRDGELERYMTKMWERAGTVEIQRQEPIATRTGKVLPFHLTDKRVS